MDVTSTWQNFSFEWIVICSHAEIILPGFLFISPLLSYPPSSCLSPTPILLFLSFSSSLLLSFVLSSVICRRQAISVLSIYQEKNIIKSTNGYSFLVVKDNLGGFIYDETSFRKRILISLETSSLNIRFYE